MGIPWRRSPRGLAAAAAIAVLVAGCAGGGAGPTPSPGGGSPAASLPVASSGATPAPSPLATGPATFALTVAGDPNVTGTWGSSFGITCNNPTFGGPNILFFAKSPDAKAVVLVTLAAGSIGVSERAGQGAFYTDREFQGSGVSSFDPARGATVDSDLTIAPNPGGKPGTLGTITHVSGSIDCGNQLPGSSTVVASGTAPDGPMSGPFTAVRVQCNTSAQFGMTASATAIITAGTNRQLLIINLTPNHNATIFSIGQNPGTATSYKIDPAGTLTITATGAHLDADFVQVLATGATGTPDRIHLAGDLTCGTFLTS